MRIRVIRLLEYEGDAEWVFKTLEKNSVKGESRVGDNVIREAIIGTVPEILSRKESEDGKA